MSNKSRRKSFSGVEVQTKTEKSRMASLTKIVGVTSTIGYSGAAGALTFSSLFSGSLSSLSHLIQIVEFGIPMELFNFKFDPVLGKFMASLRQATDFKMIPMPLNKLASDTHNSKAGAWKGKLSMIDMKPYLFQEIGYPGILIIVKKSKIFIFNFF